MEVLFIVLFAYLRKVRSQQLQKAANLAASKASDVLPIEQVKQAFPTLVK